MCFRISPDIVEKSFRKHCGPEADAKRPTGEGTTLLDTPRAPRLDLRTIRTDHGTQRPGLSLDLPRFIGWVEEVCEDMEPEEIEVGCTLVAVALL